MQHGRDMSPTKRDHFGPSENIAVCVEAAQFRRCFDWVTAMGERLKLSKRATVGEPDLRDDLIWGIAGENGIAAFIGKSVRQAYYLVERGVLPVRRLGPKTIVASRSELKTFFARGEASPVSYIADEVEAVGNARTTPRRGRG